MDFHMSIPKLPVEIIEKILFYTDSLTILNAALTCKSWNVISQRFLKDNLWWKKCCESELNSSEAETVLQSIVCNYLSPILENGVNWRLVIKCVRRWQTIDNWKIATKIVNATSPNYYIESATSLGTAEKLILTVINSNDYLVATKDYFELCTKYPVFSIRDLIVDCNGKVIDTVSKNCALIYPREPVEILRKCAAIDYVEEKIVYYSRGTVYCMDLKYIQNEMKRNDPRVLRSQAIESLAKNYNQGSILALSFWKSCIWMLNEHGFLLKVKNNAVVKKRAYNFSIHSIKQAFMFTNIIFTITTKGDIIIYQMCLFKEIKKAGAILRSLPVVIYLHGNLLFIGLFNGNVFIYHFKDIMDINLSCYQQKVVCDPFPILQIEAKEKYNYLHVLLTTGASVHELHIQSDNA